MQLKLYLKWQSQFKNGYNMLIYVDLKKVKIIFGI